jgi:hypothetical protein
VLAVAEIDSIQVGAHTPHAGRPGPMYKALYDAYQFEIVRICNPEHYLMTITQG